MRLQGISWAGTRVSVYLYWLTWYFGAYASSSSWINYPSDGFATMTHYGLPLGAIAACGCAPLSTYYPTAALSQMAYGSSQAYGPACGVCFNLTLLNTFKSTPPFYPNVTKSVVVKITDLCPLSKDGWCCGTNSKTNAAGHYLNFDLAYPSPAIPTDFFPSNASEYGYTDFGVWNISYAIVACEPNWAGAQNTSALGAAANIGPEAVCCPADVTANDTCSSYSDDHGISPTNMPSSAHQLTTSTSLSAAIITVFVLSFMFSFTTYIGTHVSDNIHAHYYT